MLCFWKQERKACNYLLVQRLDEVYNGGGYGDMLIYKMYMGFLDFICGPKVDLKAIAAQGALIVDIRTPGEYASAM